jgi:hypothetical protein
MLVVVDEPLVSRVIARILAAEARSSWSSTASDALARLQGGERFDDRARPMMPDLRDGVSLALHSTTPRSPIGWCHRRAFTTAREFLASVLNARLEKPLDVTALREAVRRV